MRRILHWFLACLPWIILLSFRSTSFFIHSIVLFIVSSNFLSFRDYFFRFEEISNNRERIPLLFPFLFFFVSKVNRVIFQRRRKYIYIYKTKRFRIEGFDHCGIDSKWIDLKCSAISTRLNKIISFPFSIFHATHHFIAISLFYQNRTLYYIFGSVFDPPPFPLPPYEYNIDHYDIYLYITILFD